MLSSQVSAVAVSALHNSLSGMFLSRWFIPDQVGNFALCGEPSGANTLPGNYLCNAVIFEGEKHQQALAAQASSGAGPSAGVCHTSPPQSSPMQAEVTTTRLGPFCRHIQRLNWIASQSPWDCLNGLNCIKLGLFWSLLSVKFCHPIATSLCHRREQQSNWKCFLETRHVVSAARWALSSPRDRNWKCFLREQQGLLNAW